jgi:hypothetical protein
MNLYEVVSNIETLHDGYTIYAVTPWHPLSEAECAVEPSDVSVPESISKKGMVYFLEVFLAREFLNDFNCQGSYTMEQQCERLIQYATNDA